MKSNVCSNRITFGHLPTQSPRRTNITFSYTSPSKRRHHSNDARLTTKAFKERHFPALGKHLVETEKNVVREQEKKNGYYQLYTDEETPRQPRILKLNKAKSKQKLEITLSPKLSERNTS